MSVEWIVIGITVTMVCSLIGVIYFAGQSRDDKQDARFERNENAANDHVRQDAAMHERLVRIETKVAALEIEVNKLRDMRHEIASNTTAALSSWYASVVEMVGKRFAELTALIERAQK